MLRIRGNRKEVVDKINDRIKRHLRQERRAVVNLRAAVRVRVQHVR
jgi:hypothetical protein